MSLLNHTYEEFINQFPIISNPNIAEIRKSLQPGYCYHHIVPISHQARIYGIVKGPEVIRFRWDDRCDKRCVLLSYQDHAFAHWLFDKEHSEYHTARYFRNQTAKLHKIHLSEKAFLSMDADYVYELFEVLNHTDLSKKTGRLTKAMWQDKAKRDSICKSMSEAKIGKPNVCRDRVWIHKVIDGQKVFKRVTEESLSGYIEEGWSTGYKATRGKKSEEVL